jgi:hypothetical protein
MFIQAGHHRWIVGTGRRRSIDNDHIQSGQQRLMLAKRLSHRSFDAVSCRCPPTLLFGNREAQAAHIHIIAPAKYGK